jgi:hypothetical protein
LVEDTVSEWRVLQGDVARRRAGTRSLVIGFAKK